MDGLFPSLDCHFRSKKLWVVGGVSGLEDYSVSPSPNPFPLDFGIFTWIWDLGWDLDLGLDLGLTILNIRKRVLSYSFSELQENKILAWAFIVNSKTKHHLNSHRDFFVDVKSHSVV